MHTIGYSIYFEGYKGKIILEASTTISKEFRIKFEFIRFTTLLNIFLSNS